MVDLNKGATVELVKVLSDDIRTDANGVKHSSAGAAIRDVCSAIRGDINNLDEKSGKLLIPAGNKTYLAQLQVVNNKPVLVYAEEE